MWDEDEYFEQAQRQYMERVRGDGEVPSAEQFAALQQAAGVIHTAQRTGVLSSTWNAPAEAAGLAEALMYLRVGAPGPLLANQVEALAETVLKVRRATSGWNPPGYANSDDDELYDEQAAKRWHDTSLDTERSLNLAHRLLLEVASALKAQNAEKPPAPAV